MGNIGRFSTVAQALGKPVQTDPKREVTGDTYDLTGFIDVNPVAGDTASAGGVLSYSFKGPALTGQEFVTPSNLMPAVPGAVDVDFPVRFTEQPVPSFSFSAGENALHGELVPMTAKVIAWKLGRRGETGLPFYDGARVLVTAQPGGAGGSVSPIGGPEILYAHWGGSEVAAPAVSGLFEFEYAIHQGGSHLAWSQSDRSIIDVLANGFVFAHARVITGNTVSTNKYFGIYNDGYDFGHAILPAGLALASGGGFHVIDLTEVTTGNVVLQHNALGVTPTAATLVVEFHPGATTFQGS